MTNPNSKNPEAIDAVWRQMVSDGNDTAICLEAGLQQAAQEMEEYLTSLRDLARQKLATLNDAEG